MRYTKSYLFTIATSLLLLLSCEKEELTSINLFEDSENCCTTVREVFPNDLPNYSSIPTDTSSLLISSFESKKSLYGILASNNIFRIENIKFYKSPINKNTFKIIQSDFNSFTDTTDAIDSQLYDYVAVYTVIDSITREKRLMKSLETNNFIIKLKNDVLSWNRPKNTNLKHFLLLINNQALINLDSSIYEINLVELASTINELDEVKIILFGQKNIFPYIEYSNEIVLRKNKSYFDNKGK